ncbi:DUF1761 domain-containing protein [Demequina sp. TTPB684]|uniref:DUF1761 domain-containing protein n=1 Tax=unclassified Demequina TaxID=2620311 RepID=UPI001CF50CF4|nr:MULTISPECIES: DUF1761 domain-containing protein [unclassified Demequina]MCB2412249.1 DUF1761 domain-containing protein [Demequina sp. TTPB684]UPU87112.1 DUF1761 domain-containing protein [Demequina sp. TMPB413]
MEWFDLGAINWWAVVVAFVLSFGLGWLWYSPQGFFVPWKRAAGFTDEQMREADMGIAFAGTVVANVLGVLLLAVLMAAADVSGGWQGLAFGAIVGLVFRGGAHALHNGFAIRKPLVTVIDAAHDTVALALAGLVIGLM